MYHPAKLHGREIYKFARYTNKDVYGKETPKKSTNKGKNKTLNNTSTKYTALAGRIHCLNILIKQNMEIHMRHKFEERLEKIKAGPDMFREVNKVTGRNKFKKPDRLKINGKYSMNSEEMAQEFSRYYADLYKEITPNSNSNLSNEVSRYADDIQSSNEATVKFTKENPACNPVMKAPSFVSIEDTKTMVKALNCKKSSGPDGISNYVIKKLPHRAIKLITIILNNCMNNMYFPRKWKEAIILPIPKKTKAESPSEYRPISLTNNLGKMLEQIILQNINYHIYDERQPCIPEFQFGFRSAHSTVDALTYLKDEIVEAANKRMVTTACLLDIEKAFDSVWRKGVIYKLGQIKLPNKLIKLTSSFLTDRSALVNINGEKSNKFVVGRGVPQGTKLGPPLYNIYTADQPVSEDKKTKTLLYADDTIVFSKSLCPNIAARKVEEHLVTLEKYYSKWGIKINEAKSQLIVFRPTYGRCSKNAIKKSQNIKIIINNTTVKTMQEVKYLGITMNHKLKFNKHITLQMDKARRAYSVIHPIIRQLKLKTNIKETLYKQLIRPILSYGFPVWASISPTKYGVLQKYERRIIRAITGKFRKPPDDNYNYPKYYSCKELYESVKIQEITEHLEGILQKAIQRNNCHPNRLLTELREREPTQEQYYINTEGLKNITFGEFIKINANKHRG